MSDEFGTPPPYRDGRVHVLSRKCDTCVLRPGNLMHLHAGRLRDLIETNLAEDTAYSCHDTLTSQAGQALCRGFVDRYWERVTPVRMAFLLNCVTYVDPPEVHR